IRWLRLPPWRDETNSWGPRSLEMLFELLYGTFADVLLLYLSVVVAAHAYAYFVHGQRQEIERLELRQSLAQSELQALRAQLHPHFLFNTLQGISTLIETDRVTAQGMLRALAALRDGRLQVLIRNTVGGRSQPGLGVGIANARARLKYLYSDDASLDFRLEQDGALAIISLTLPAFATVADEDSDEPARAARTSES